MPKVKRHVIGIKENKMSGVIYSDNPEYQEVPQIFWRTTLWNTTEFPVDNTIGGDRAKNVTQREPTENGLTWRALEIPPDIPDSQKHIEILQDLNKKVKQKYPPTPMDLERHPSMHRTDTLDMFVVGYGEIYLVTDSDEVLLRQGDTALVKGVNHAWSNRSHKPCMLFGVMVHAKPYAKDVYPAEGL
jgi:mannose-6-phosphate isomerase-like protein (cupin superfamily)